MLSGVPPAHEVSLEMSPFLLLIANNTAVAECVSQVRGRGGKGRRLSPFPPAQRLIELHCAHREYVLFLLLGLFLCVLPFFREKFRARIASEGRFPTAWTHSLR